ncbi:MAG: hypothetical protein E7354_05275 [Clostridiales bacterium]|nr:hypothetical protein [Clostridiales bacterium]
MRDFYVLPRAKGTYSKLINKLKKNGFAYIPYTTEELDLSKEEDVSKLIEYLRAKEKADKDLDGTSVKFFARIDDSINQIEGVDRGICDSRYFSEYITELQNNPDCSYVSIYNDLIRNEKYIPRYFSALIKDCHNDPDRAKAEIFGSKVANVLGVPTAYYFGIKDETLQSDGWNGEIEGDVFAVATLDFVPQGYSIETFKEMGQGKRGCGPCATLDSWLRYIDVCLENKYPDGVNQKCRQSLREDFVRTYLYRVALFPDFDFTVYNAGAYVKDDSDEFGLMPNFDMEGMMYEHLYQARGNYYKPNRKRLKRLVSYCNEHFPNVISDFMARLEKAHNSGVFMEFLDETFGEKNEVIYTNVHNACETMLECYKNPQIGIVDYLLR